MFKGVAPRFVLHPDRFQLILQVNVLFITSVVVMVHVLSADGAHKVRVLSYRACVMHDVDAVIFETNFKAIHKV
jgi:hypothetical protein